MVVDLCIRSDGEYPLTAGEREVLVEGFRGRPEHAVAEPRPDLPVTQHTHQDYGGQENWSSGYHGIVRILSIPMINFRYCTHITFKDFIGTHLV
jgi:hypothetical protein